MGELIKRVIRNAKKDIFKVIAITMAIGYSFINLVFEYQQGETIPLGLLIVCYFIMAFSSNGLKVGLLEK